MQVGPADACYLDGQRVAGLYRRRHINRAVRDLRDGGLIRWVGSEIEILDWDGLVRLARFDPAYLRLERVER